MATCARETRNKTHHARSGGATGGPWCVLFPVSRARACVQRRYRRARMYRPAPARGGTPLPRPPTLAPVMPQGPPLCWERLRQGCTKLENAAHAVIFERMASDGKKINLDHIRRLRACLGGTRPGGGLRPRPPGSPGILCCPETPKTLFFHKKQRVAWRDKVRFLGVAEKHVVRELLCKQKLFDAPAELRECKEVIIFCTSILCP